MIVRLKGRVEEIRQDSIVLMCNAIGFLVFCSQQTRDAVTLGQEAMLEIATQARDGDIRFYGFANATERSYFSMLSSVQGVGGKLALAILSQLGLERLQHALWMKDKSALRQVTGLGAKLATRILSELEGKGETASFSAHASPPPSALWQDVGAALESLGFENADIARTCEKLRANADPQDFTSLEEALRAALHELRPADR